MPHASRGDVVARDLAAVEINLVCAIRVELDARVYRWENPFPDEHPALVTWRRNLAARDVEEQLAVVEPKLRLSSGTLTDRSVDLADRVHRAHTALVLRLRQLNAEARRARTEDGRKLGKPASTAACSRRPGMPRVRSRERRSPAARRTSTSRDDGPGSHGDPDPLSLAALVGRPLTNFHRPHEDLTGTERLHKFLAQPLAVQTVAYAALREAVEQRSAA